MQLLRVLGIVGASTLGVARQAWGQETQPIAPYDPVVCSEWTAKLRDSIGTFRDFRSLAEGIGVGNLIDDGLAKPIAMPLPEGSDRCLSTLIASNPDLSDSAEFLPLRLRLLNTNGDGRLDKREAEAKIKGAKTEVDSKKNAEAAAYAVVIARLSRTPENKEAVPSAPSTTVSSAPSPAAVQLDETLRNAQEKNRNFLIAGAAIAAAAIGVLWLLKKIVGTIPWRYALVKIFPSQHERFLKAPRRKALQTITRIRAAKAGARQRIPKPVTPEPAKQIEKIEPDNTERV